MKKNVRMVQFGKLVSSSAVVLFIVMMLFSCGGREGSTENLAGVTPSKVQQVDCETAVIAEIVTMQTDSLDRTKEFFVPAAVTVKRNEVVKWINTDDNNWWVQSNALTVPEDSSFYSGPFSPGKSYCLKFTVPGRFDYHCKAPDPETGLGGVTAVVIVQ